MAEPRLLVVEPQWLAALVAGSKLVVVHWQLAQMAVEALVLQLAEQLELPLQLVEC